MQQLQNHVDFRCSTSFVVDAAISAALSELENIFPPKGNVTNGSEGFRSISDWLWKEFSVVVTDPY